jgi:hypothetical protein
MRVVFMGKSKRSAVRALDWLVERGVEVVAVVAPEPDRWTREAQRLDLAVRRHGLPLVSDADLYADPPAGVDLVISFLFWKLIREPLISLGRIGCLNFHPAPLPDFRGVGGYNLAVLEGLAEWGVSCHFVDERFDTGDLVEVERFAIDPAAHTAFSLDMATGAHLLDLFRRVVARAGRRRAATPAAGRRALRLPRGLRAPAGGATRRRSRAQAARVLVPAPSGRGDRRGRPPPHTGRRRAAGRGGRRLPRCRAAPVAKTADRRNVTCVTSQGLRAK